MEDGDGEGLEGGGGGEGEVDYLFSGKKKVSGAGGREIVRGDGEKTYPSVGEVDDA